MSVPSWQQLHDYLRHDFGRMWDEDTAILSYGRRFVQFQYFTGITLEVASNTWLPEDEQLSPGQCEALLALGWQEPETGPGVSGNFWQRYSPPWPGADLFDRLTNCVVVSLRILGAEHPGQLTVKTWDTSGQPPVDRWLLPLVATLMVRRPCWPSFGRCGSSRTLCAWARRSGRR